MAPIRTSCRSTTRVMSKRSDIPPLNPLHVFEVASRLMSFTKAAAELNVTQSAVSRQISTLEGAINVKLFNRGRDGISLTESGEAYRSEIGPAFARILSATNEIRDCRQSAPLRLRVYSTFAARWLIPRLPAFTARHPGIEFRMNTGVQPVDFSRDSADMAIQFGDGNWTDISCKKIRDDRGYWQQVEEYISTHSDTQFTHSICPHCTQKLYPDLDIESDPKN